jgi:hypothetical protein
MTFGCLATIHLASAGATEIKFQEDNLPDGSYQSIALDIRSNPSEQNRNRATSASGGVVSPVFFGRANTSNGDDDRIRGLFGYDLSAIPAGSTIDSVSFTLWSRNNDANSLDRDFTINLYELSGSIIEGTGTLTLNPSAATGPSWTMRDVDQSSPVDWTDGGEFGSTSLASFTGNPKTIGTDTIMPFTSTAAFITAAQAALDGSGTLYFIGLSEDAEALDTDQRGLFQTRSDDNSGTIGAAGAPLLTINYTPVPEPSTLALGVIGMAAVISASRRRRQ